MIDLESLRFRIDIGTQRTIEGTLKEDGFYHDEDDGFLHLNTPDFVVSIYSMEFFKFYKKLHEIEGNNWDFILPVIKEYFTTIDQEIIRPLCTHGSFHFEMNRYNEEPHQSEQDDIFIANYLGWIYMQFDYEYQFNTLFSIDEFKEVLNNKHHTHQVSDRGWPETKMFIQELTVENITEVFQRLIKLNRMECEIYKAMLNTRNEFYAEHEKGWINDINS